MTWFTMLVIASTSSAQDTVGSLASQGRWGDAVARIEALSAEAKNAKKLDKALQAEGLGQIRLPTVSMMGADLVFWDPQPATCAWDGTLSCSFSAGAHADTEPDAYRLLCRTPIGARLPVESTMKRTGNESVQWTAHSLEACWKLGATEINLAPVGSEELEGVGEGTDLIPPELSGLNWEQAEEIVQAALPSYQHCLAQHGVKTGGSLKVRYHITDDGTVDLAEVEGGTLTEPDTVACILAKFKRLKFPPTMGGYDGGTYELRLLGG